jgi:hypothetical protein
MKRAGDVPRLAGCRARLASNLQGPVPLWRGKAPQSLLESVG